MGTVSQPVSAEIYIIKSLQAQQGRLRTKEYQPFPNPRLVSKGLLDQLEDGLRDALLTINVDLLCKAEGELAKETTIHLKTVCNKLEQIVNSHVVPPVRSEGQDQTASSYTNLQALIRILQQSTWEFDLVAARQTCATLFQPVPEEMIVDLDRRVKELRRVCQALQQPSVKDLLPEKEFPKEVTEEIERASNLHRSLKAPFEQLLRGLPRNLPDSNNKRQVLVQLLDPADTTRESFNLFLWARSKSSNRWQWLDIKLESEHQDPHGEEDWENIQEHYDEIEEHDPQEGSIWLSVRAGTMHRFNPIRDRVRQTTHPGKTPTKTLEELLHRLAFSESSGYVPTRDLQNCFSSVEKRRLAAKLVLGLGHSWDSGHVLESWDPRTVYFLTGQDEACVREFPYTLCVARGPDESHGGTLSDVQSLSKLLLCIEYGCDLPDISDSGRLEKEIWDALREDLRRVDYLNTVKDCLTFHGKAKQQSRLMNAKGLGSDSVARMVIALRLAKRIRNAPLRDQVPEQRQDTTTLIDGAPEIAPVTLNEITILPSSATKNSESWFKGLNKVTCVLDLKGSQAGASQPVRIAILDTGLSEKYRGLVPAERYYDFVNPSQKECQDTAGHGTQMFKVLRRVYGDAEIYIGRVFETSQAGNSTADLMEEAIKHAVDDKGWAVDIIAMPSGFQPDQYHKGIFNAITKATTAYKPVLFFAAAGNWANTYGVAFPGNQYNSVIPMFSTTSDNKPTPWFNPAPISESGKSFAIFGQQVVISQNEKALDGTSVSTMIGAGLAGRILSFAHHPDNMAKFQIKILERLRLAAGMSSVFKAMSNRINEYDCIVPERLLPSNAEELDLDEVRETVRRKISEQLDNLWR